jgi:hypothetical protein
MPYTVASVQMRLRSTPSDLLLRLPQQASLEDQLASFRQALTALAQSTSALGPPSLDGIDARALESSAFLALERGFTADLSFLGPGAGALALYELSSACPPGQVKRDLRRRVFSLLYEGHAGAFLPVATRIALGAAGPLLTPTLRARVALCLELPVGTELNVAPLAHALATRSATYEAWIDQPSTRALPARRTAALLFEHAAREAVFRFQLGDPQPRNLLLAGDVRSAFRRLLLDREPLVWRHAAVARGLLAAIHPETREAVEQSLSPDLGVTEWRRASISLVASTVLGDEEAHSSVHAVIGGPLAERDPGIAAVMASGLLRVIEFEPDRAEEILDRLATTRREDVALAVAEVFAQLRDPSFAPAARGILRDVLLEAGRRQGPLERSLSARALKNLGRGGSDEGDLGQLIHRALVAFEEQNARSAYEGALSAVSEAHELASFIESTSPGESVGLGAALAALEELDAGVFQRGTLANLLLLGRRPGDPGGTVEQLERLQNRTSNWILDGVDQSARPWSRELAFADQRRLRVLLHLVDAESAAGGDGESPLTRRLQRAIRALIARLSDDPDTLVHRVLCAALARSFDAAVREDVMQASDLVLVVANLLVDNYSVHTVAEASTSPDVASPLEALAEFIAPDLLEPGSEHTDTSTGMLNDPALASTEEIADKLRVVGRVMALSQGVVGGGGYHAEALRRVFFRLGRALEMVAIARGQAELLEARETDPPVLDELQYACEDLLRMIRCAERRVLGGEGDRPSSGYSGPGLRGVIDRALSSGARARADELAEAIEHLVAGLPEPVARAVSQVTLRVHDLPASSTPSVAPVPLAKRRAPLPDWLLPRRTIGSFYVVRPLGAGGVSSVFLARRLEERNNPQAEAFALKVPEYDPATARSMSEQEFFDMFRDEAGALLSLPAHENIARFVTFDLSARPKPILVMELISGTPLDRLVRSRSLSMPRVIQYVDGILAGLEAMHGVGVGHLDVKASNVILRDGRTPVLVDFGLSGRKLRPGCGTIEYTSPEVLGVVPDGTSPAPPAADIYAFGCLLYELLTGEVLFSAPDEMSLVTKHVSHDGWLAELAALGELRGLARLSRVIASCIRHDPANRPSATELRDKLTAALLPLSDLPWPLRIAPQAEAV